MEIVVGQGYLRDGVFEPVFVIHEERTGLEVVLQGGGVVKQVFVQPGLHQIDVAGSVQVVCVGDVGFSAGKPFHSRIGISRIVGDDCGVITISQLMLSGPVAPVVVQGRGDNAVAFYNYSVQVKCLAEQQGVDCALLLGAKPVRVNSLQDDQ